MAVWLTYNDDQSNDLKMHKAVKSYMEGIPQIIAESPAFAGTVLRYTGKIAQISSMGQSKDDKRTGKTNTKNTMREEYINETHRLMGLAKNYGTATRNQEIIDACKISKSEMKKLRDNLLVNKGKSFLALMNANMPALVDYLITALVVTAYTDMTDAFDNITGKTESSIGESKAATKLLKQYFTECAGIASELDAFMEGVSKQYPVEYESYKAIRTIKDLGVRHDGETTEVVVEPPATPGG